ncbi:MAG: metallopeptidase TldD-related protein, partial [Buchnera aphidicola]|nr:metallopeptidase TldD-related protein [Buchnera aphidicola]
LINAISGSNIYQKSTFLINCFQKRIFPEWLNIKEDPHIKKGLGSKPFDAEGVATYSKYIIKRGILKTWLLNSYFAKKLNQCSTGNSGGSHNWIINNTNISFKELLKQMKR